jgi:hypothetical protein
MGLWTSALALSLWQFAILKANQLIPELLLLLEIFIPQNSNSFYPLDSHQLNMFPDQFCKD